MTKKQEELNFDIDYDMFETVEIIKIVEFFNLIESTKHKNISTKLLKEKYREYQNILRSKTLEKKYDEMLFKRCGVSIYKVMKQVLGNK